MKLREILASIRKKDGGEPSRIRELIDEVERKRDEAHARLASLAGRRTEALLDDDLAGIAKIDADAQKAHFEIEQSEVVLPQLQEALANALSRDAEAERLARYAEADEATKKAKAALRKYPGLAREIVSILKTVAEAEQTIAQTNLDLPSGKQPIESPEQSVRGLPAKLRRVVSERTTEPTWFYDGPPWGKVDKRDHGSIRVDEDGVHGTLDTKHSLTDESFGNPGYGPVFKVMLRREIIREVIPPQPEFVPTPLAAELTLPAFKAGEPEVWSPVGGHPSFVLPGTNEREVLASIEALEQQQKTPAIDPRGEPVPDRIVETLEPGSMIENELSAVSSNMM